MNQILLTNNDNNNKKNSNKNYNRNNSNDIRKIIIFFATVILIFGIALSAIYGYKIFKNSNKKEKTIGEPELSLESKDEEVTIIAKAEAGINKIIYQWNEEDEIVKEYGGRTKQEESISVPDGENTLKVKVIDQVGQEIETTEEFSGSGSSEENDSKIEIEVNSVEMENENGPINILVETQAPIKYITYKRNNEEEKRIEVTEEKTQIKESIEPVKGKNNISIFVEDINGNTKQVEKTVFVKVRPKIEVYVEENKLYMSITHDKGFKKIDFNINGTEFTYDETKSVYNPEEQKIEYYFELKNGENYVKIVAESNEYSEFINPENKAGLTAVYEGRYNYE